MPCGASMRHSSFRAAVAAVALLSFTPAVSAAPAKGAAPVTEAELAAHIKVLADDAFEGRAPGPEGEDRTIAYVRSEEHTSELQSLMRISYAVFCLEKKKK